MSIGKITIGGEGYYIDAVAKGVDEYYRGVGEAPGRWAGTAAGPLGLEGEVTPEQLAGPWAGLDPATGEKLGRFAGRTLVGFDLCFRAPKSVSVLFGLGEPDVSAAVRDGHDNAVAAAFDYLEANAGWSRIGKDGLTQVPVAGLVAAGFRHRTSRAGDPHLHTHLLVANMGQCADGQWRTLDGRVLYQYARTAGFLYEAHLRHEFTERLGVEWGPVVKGIADLEGIDQTVLDAFSSRKKEIAEHLDQVGFRSARAADVAALATRSAKDRSTDAASIRDVWLERAAEIDFDPATLADVVDRVPPRVSSRVSDFDRAVLLADLVGHEGLTRQASTFTRRDVLRAIAERSPAGATVAQIEALADELFARPDVVRLVETDGPGLLATNTIRRHDGTLVAGGVDESRWSTANLIALEQHLVADALARQGEGSGVVYDDVLDAVLARRPTLSGEQIAMVAALTQHGRGVAVVSAAAGTGKTFTLDAARDAWESTGYRVVGAALAGIAAQELQASAGIPSSTLVRLNADLASRRTRFDTRTVVVVDEAAMAGTRLLASVLEAASRGGAKVVLVGDPKQLSEIDAGGVMRGLRDRIGAIEIVENRRQREPWERDALDQLRAGDVGIAFNAYRDNGRVVTAPTAIEVRQAMVADWWSHRLAGDTAVMMAVRRSDVDDLNGRARAYLVRSERVSGPTLEIGERPYQAGDSVICLKNNRRLGVNNGTRAKVRSVDVAHGTMTIEADGRRVVLPADYLEAGHLAHAYATTIHKAQGATFDRALVLGTDELHRERGYVGLSRGRASNHLYLVGAAEVDDATGHGRLPDQPDPIDAVRQALLMETDKRLAIDTGTPLAAPSVEDLLVERRRLQEILAACPPDRSHDVRALTARRDRLLAEVDGLVDRHDALVARRVLTRSRRAELGDVDRDLDLRKGALSRVTGELQAAQEATALHGQFLALHRPDRARLTAIDLDLRSGTVASRTDLDLERPTQPVTEAPAFELDFF